MEGTYLAMCGLYGFATKKSHGEYIGAFKALGLLMESRGRQATGYVNYVVGKPPVIVKDAVCASDFYPKRFIDPNSYACIGHTRLGTKGANIAENAHPYNYGKVIGAHNGILTNDDDVAKEHQVMFAVDSQAIFYLLNKYDNDYVKAFGELRGSMAVTWSHVGNDGYTRFYAFRHNNPLFLAYTDDDNCVFWASEYDALQIVLASLNQSNNETYTLTEDIVHGLNNSLEFEPLSNKIELKPYVYPKENKKYPWSKNYQPIGFLGSSKKNKKNKKQRGFDDMDFGDWGGSSSKYDYDYETGLYKPKKEQGESTEGINWSKDERIDFIAEYGRQLAGEQGCLICHQPIMKTSYFYINASEKNTFDTYHIGCFKNKQACPYDDVMWVGD